MFYFGNKEEWVKSCDEIARWAIIVVYGSALTASIGYLLDALIFFELIPPVISLRYAELSLSIMLTALLTLAAAVMFKKVVLSEKNKK